MTHAHSLALAFMAVLIWLIPAEAAAQTPAAPIDAQRSGKDVALSEAELSAFRGGFMVAQGIELDFGAVVRTYVDGQLALESRLTWTETGAVTQNVAGSVAGATDLAASLDAAFAAGIDLAALRQGQGLLLSDANGTTALVHNLQSGQLSNLIINTADGRDLRQEIEVTLTLPNLETLQRGYAIEGLGAQIGQDISAAMIQALAR